MAAQIISFLKHAPASRDWSRDEIAEFYRVESALVQAGLHLETDRGLSDEGDPWFIFCRVDNGEVFIHFARIDGQYVIDGAVFETATRGDDFAGLVRQLIARHPLARSRGADRTNVFLHPAALLIALVGTAFFHTSEAKAAETTPHKVEPRRHVAWLTSSAGVNISPDAIVLDASQATAIITGAIIVLRQEALLASFAPPAPAPGAPAAGVVADPGAVVTHASLLQDIVGKPHLGLAGAESPPAMLPAHEIRVVLALAAVLSDLATLRTGPELGVGGGLIAAPAPGEIAASAALDLASSASSSVLATTGRPVVIVSLTADSLPDVEAVHIMQSNGVFAELDVKTLPQLDHLPAILANLIVQGEHIDGSHPISTTPTLPPVVSDTHVIAPVSPEPTAPIGHDPAIDAAVSAFTAEVHQLDAVLSGRDVVIYDRQIFGSLPAGTILDSVTFKLEDGGTISLVGTAQEIQNLHLH